MERNEDFSNLKWVCTDTVFYAAYSEASDSPLPVGFESFTSMMVTMLLRNDDRRSDECFGIGMSAQERHTLLMDQAVFYLQTSLETDCSAMDRDVRTKLREFAVSLWFCSHHRN